MKKMNKKILCLYRTNYYGRSWTWIRRMLVVIFLWYGALTLYKDEGHLPVGLVLLLISFYVILRPKDDLAVDAHYLYHIRRSLFKVFTRVDRYRISDLYSIRCGGVHDDLFELVDVFNGGGSTGGYSNTVEMTFKDNTSKSLNVAIGRKNLNKIVKLVNELRIKNATSLRHLS